MSLIVKSAADATQEITIPAKFAPLLELLGAKNSMSRTALLAMLEQGLASTVAQGDGIGYEQLTNAMAHLSAWKTSMIHLETKND